jgi:hypothetical protein
MMRLTSAFVVKLRCLKTYEKLLTQTDSNKNCSDSIEPSKLFTVFAQEIPLTD